MQLYEQSFSESRGRHLVATQDIEKGQIVLTERPLLALQSLDNRAYNQNCHCCLAFVGDADSSLCRRFGKDSGALDGGERTNSDSCRVVPCRDGCGLVYCSKECESDGWNGHHKYLCTGKCTEGEALVQFKTFAVETNEILLLVAEWWIAEHTSPNPEPYSDFTMNPWWDILTESLRREPGGFAEAFQLQKDLEQMCTDAANLMNQFMDDSIPRIAALDIAKRIGSCEQNAMGIRQRNPLCRYIFDRNLRERRHQEVIEALLSAGFIGQEEGEGANDDAESQSGNDETVDGDFVETKNIPNNDPSRTEVWDYSYDEIAEFLANLFIDEDGSVIDLAMPDAPERDTVGDDLDYVFYPLDGTAMYSKICKMNHSCDPNIAVMYKRVEYGSKYPLCAYAIAQRHIKKGEELLISYIESKAPYHDRQASLESYGFHCECPRCLLDGKALRVEDGPESVKKLSSDNGQFDMFGSDGEVDSTDGTQLVQDTDSSNPETLLQSRLERLDTVSNGSRMGSIPPHLLARLKSFIFRTIQLERDELRDFETSLLDKCIDAVENNDFCMCEIVGKDLHDTLYHELTTHGSWEKFSSRRAFWCSSITLSIGLAHRRAFLPAMAYLDTSMVLGLPTDDRAIKEYVEYVTYCSQGEISGPYQGRLEKNRVFDMEIVREPEIDFPVTSVNGIIDEEFFLAEYVGKSRPLRLEGFASKWSATEHWKHVQWWTSRHGHRVVPIEVGSILAGSMEEKLVTIRKFFVDFLLTHPAHCTLQDILQNPRPTAYLAQHPLLDQIVSLQEGLEMWPILCGEGALIRNCWIGTAGTRTPLHYDAYDNLLVQIVGYKYVRLYDRSYSNRLYVSNDGKYGLQGNISELDCENEDYERHPAAKDLPYQEVLLRPGDCLYIPSKCWHYVRSLTTSMSVNYWF